MHLLLVAVHLLLLAMNADKLCCTCLGMLGACLCKGGIPRDDRTVVDGFVKPCQAGSLWGPLWKYHCFFCSWLCLLSSKQGSILCLVPLPGH